MDIYGFHIHIQVYLSTHIFIHIYTRYKIFINNNSNNKLWNKCLEKLSNNITKHLRMSENLPPLFQKATEGRHRVACSEFLQGGPEKRHIHLSNWSLSHNRDTTVLKIPGTWYICASKSLLLDCWATYCPPLV